jgi:hypothetical protein
VQSQSNEKPAQVKKERSLLLLVDSLINVVLGVLLIPFPTRLVELLGVPKSDTSFYASILGAVLLGIGIALFLEWRRKSQSFIGLGLGGAIAINLCGGIVLAGWLLFADLDIETQGSIFLWALVIILIVISGLEGINASRRHKDA